ncbi:MULTISPECIES: PaaI family thioesterase [unclassified Delftia]|uniref:PaaI family thioesterase n=1 Tax=unclassified Delftia TaxID=2613839 RepID=UPI000645FDA0|nr:MULTISPECIES: PaaI family thioesterase [unclassified Delftia]MDC2858704.1 PaaI family thioesterase [Delftia sp. DT-2]
MHLPRTYLPVLDYLQRQIEGRLAADEATHMRYPTAISQMLGFRIVAVGEAMAVVEFDADAQRHGNQQGTVHGGMLCELADAAIGTAHSTLMEPGQSFTSIDLKAAFLRPVWRSRLCARAWAEHRGRTISHYRCEIERDDGKAVASIASAVLTLRGEHAQGR